jgi:hypothetical protein
MWELLLRQALYFQSDSIILKFEVLSLMTFKIPAFWDIMSCRWVSPDVPTDSSGFMFGIR